MTAVVPDSPLPLATAVSDPAAAAAAHAGDIQSVFGSTGSVGELVVDTTFPVGEGTTVRLRQEIDGVPVHGASVAQSLAADGSLIAVTGSVAQRSQGTYADALPGGQELALAAATADVSAQTQKPLLDYAATDSERTWYDPKLAAVPDADSLAVPAYKVTVRGGDTTSAWEVFVDAADPTKVLDRLGSEQNITRVVCDANRQTLSAAAASGEGSLCGTAAAFKPVRGEGDSPSPVADVNAVYDYFGDTDTFFNRNTSLKDLTALIGTTKGGGPKALRGTVRTCIQGEECPYANAFWSGDHMVFGEGVSTDDITAHELSHGVTQYTSNLVYRSEPGAINESMSDVFGELTDLTNGSADDTEANRWLIGEGSSLGVIRNMKTPGAVAVPQPDTYRGANWKSTINLGQFNDYGGVHGNSGVGNKTAQLIVDGGSLNGQTVAGIGIVKTANLYWTTQTILSSNSTYASLATALKTACAQNVASNVAATTTADCTQVANATRATKIAP
ncbi:M4 family metallopeptidase [Rhodococcus qingshengii]|uniref:M4 family metallopeptidase n=1 Tax=Rhodococcus qingshengii TaxID=334542 RepID=UPI00364EA04C